MLRSEVSSNSLQRLLTRGGLEATRWFDSMEPWRPPGPRRFYPGRTLRTLHLVGLTHFQAGLLLVRRPLLSYAADDHVRVLIELVAHTSWISDAGGLEAPMSARGRALCVELGMAKALADELEVLEADLRIQLPSGYTEGARGLARHFSRLHAKQACDCAGRGRRSRDVRRTLRALSSVSTENRLGSATLLYGMWLTFSRSGHHPRLELLAADAPGGAALKPATMHERAVTLYNLLLVQSYLAVFAAAPFPAAQRRISVSALMLLQDAERLTRSGQ